MERKKLSNEERRELENNLLSLAVKIDMCGLDGETFSLDYFKSLTDEELLKEQKRLYQREENLTLIVNYLDINDKLEGMALIASSDEELITAATKIQGYYTKLRKCVKDLKECIIDKEDQEFIESLIRYQDVSSNTQEINEDAKEEFLEQSEVKEAYGDEDVQKLNFRYNANIVITN